MCFIIKFKWIYLQIFYLVDSSTPLIIFLTSSLHLIWYYKYDNMLDASYFENSKILKVQRLKKTKLKYID